MGFTMCRRELTSLLHSSVCVSAILVAGQADARAAPAATAPGLETGRYVANFAPENGSAIEMLGANNLAPQDDDTSPQDAAVPSDTPGQDASSAAEDIVVTGYRRSLEDSANAKKNATNFTDSIYSEDVGKFPDLNLAESLQRLPGVQIDRDRAGEGTTINVRGLSAGFTVTTVNGFNTATSSYAGNEGRGSSLDVLPNELFRRLTLSKSPTADMVEGGTAGVVDLQPLRAFDRKGFNVSLQAQGQYQDASGSTTPRAALIVSNRFDTGIGEFGILGAVAWAQRDYRTETFDTIGWTTLNVTQSCPTTPAGIASGCNSLQLGSGGYGNGARAGLTTVPGNVPSELGLGAPGSPLVQCLNGAPGGTSGLSCQDLSYTLVPRLMRAEQTVGKRRRIGGLINLEYRPIPELRFRGDILYSDQKNEFRQYQNMLVVRSYTNQIPVDFTINDDRVLTSGTFANTYFLNQAETGDTPSNLVYRSGAIEWDIADGLKFSVSGMHNKVEQTITSLQYSVQSAAPTTPYTVNPAGTTYTGNSPAANLNPTNTGQYGTYNYTPGDLAPSLSTNVDIAKFNQYYWNDARNGITRQNINQKALRFDLVGGSAETFQLSTGFMKNVYDRRVTSYAGAQITGCFLRGYCGQNFASQAPSLLEVIPDSKLPGYMISLPSLPLFKGAPFNAGFNNGWQVIDIDRIGREIDLEYFRESINPGETADNYGGSFARRDLLEDTTSGYLMADGRQEIFGRELRFNAGVRYASTLQRANGRVNDFILIGGTGPVIREFSSKYDNFLPSANFAYFLRSDLLVRGAAARTVTGVNPADLLPGYSLDQDATTFDLGNPKLQPFTADNFDVGIEWYPRSRTVLSFNAWWKKIYNYPFVLPTQQAFNSLGIDYARLQARQQQGIINAGGPDNALINVRQRLNSDVVINLTGYEVAWVQPLDFLIKGTGFNANVTHIKQSLSGDVPAGLNPNALLAGLAPWTYNITGYYETRAFQFRLSFVHRDENINRVCPCDNVPGDLYTASTDYLDAQISFPLPFYREAALTLQAQNLMQEVSITRFEKQEARPYNASYAGRNFVVGLRANF